MNTSSVYCHFAAYQARQSLKKRLAAYFFLLSGPAADLPAAPEESSSASPPRRRGRNVEFARRQSGTASRVKHAQTPRASPPPRGYLLQRKDEDGARSRDRRRRSHVGVGCAARIPPLRTKDARTLRPLPTKPLSKHIVIPAGAELHTRQ